MIKNIRSGEPITFDFTGTDIKKVTIVLLHGKSATLEVTADKSVRFDHHITHKP